MNPINPRELRDARINDVFVESDSRILLHLRDGRAVAISAIATGYDGETEIQLEHTNPGGAK